MSRHICNQAIAAVIVSLCVSAWAAEGTATHTLTQADAGVTVRHANGKSEAAKAGLNLSATDQLCFMRPQAGIVLKAVDTGRSLSHTEPEAGCRPLKEIVARADATGLSPVNAFKQIWAALNGSNPQEGKTATAAGRGDMITASVRGNERAERLASPFCEVPQYTDWLVLDTLQGIQIPVKFGVTGTLAQTGGADGEVPLARDGNRLVLPATGAPGQTFRVKLNAWGEGNCELTLAVVASAGHPEIPPVPADAAQPDEAAIATAAQTLTNVRQAGRAWQLESLRQVHARRKDAEEARMAEAYLATPNAECANRTSDKPIHFDVPLLQAEKSYLTAGEHGLYLAWRGGKPPYRVIVERAADQSRIVDQQDIFLCEVMLPKAQWTTGAYRLSIIDHNGETFLENNLDVLAPAQRPVAKDGAEPVTDADWFAQAQWLAGQRDGAWRLEAVRLVSEHLAETPAAQAWIARTIGAGSREE